MKTRNGFVSNSSSTSFVISAAKEESMVVEIKINFDLGRFVDYRIDNMERLNEYFFDNYCYDGQDLDTFLAQNKYVKDLYDKSVQEIKNGKCVLFGSVADYGEDGGELGTMIRSYGVKKILEQTKFNIVNMG